MTYIDKTERYKVVLVETGFDYVISDHIVSCKRYQYADYGSENFRPNVGKLELKLQTRDVRLIIVYRF